MATRPKLKVHTGCLTCKARKLKCDESKPSCRRCISSRRKCDGYADPNNASQVLALSSRRSHATARMLPNVDNLLSNTLTNNEQRWLHHFSCHTGPALSDFPDDRSFWSVDLPQLSLSEPAIRHALMAVSSCHARFDTQPGSAKQPEDFTIEHYSLAIASLRRALDLQGTNIQVPLICCLLFICLECLFGNTGLTLIHLQNGLRILDSRRVQESESPALKSVTKRLEPIFGKFKAQSTVFGISAPFATLSPESMDFTDAVLAKTKLDVLITACMGFVKHMRNDYGVCQSPADDSKRPLQKSLLDQLQAWETQMRSLERSDPPHVNSNDPSVITLHVRQQGTFAYVAICLDPHQTFCDAFLPRFEDIINLTERLVTHSGDRSAPTKPSLLSSPFSLESSMIPALYLTAIKCRDPATRHRAIGLLETHPGREGLYDARLYAKIARRVIEIEEASQAFQQHGSPQWPDERSRVYRIDVNRISEDPARSARLVFHTAPNGYFGDKVIWSEDITF